MYKLDFFPNKANFERSLLIISILSLLSFYSSEASIQDMSLEQKVGQILMVHFNGSEVNEEAITLINEIHPGAIIYYNWSNSLTSPEQVRQLSADLQKLTKIPLLIATDQEGGAVTRLTNGFTIFPGNLAVSMTEDPTLSEASAFAIAQEMLSVGVNMNLAPVVDINSNLRNPLIGIRSFGDNTQKVITFAKNALNGYRKAGVITSLKHYPGHGDVEIDSHEHLPILNKSIQQLRETELQPFAQLASEADTIMTAHLMIPTLDSNNCATLSKTILSILREEYGFKGVILSDSLVMEGLLKNNPSVDDAAIKAVNAGCDMLILGGKQLSSHQQQLELTLADVQRIHQSLINAIKNGTITEDRLNQSVDRILALKKRLLISSESDCLINCEKHKELALKIAEKALRVKKNNPSFSFSFLNNRILTLIPESIQNIVQENGFLKLTNIQTFIYSTNPTDNDIQIAKNEAKNYDTLIICTHNAWKNTSQINMLQSLTQINVSHTVLCLRDPLDATLFPNSPLILMTFSPTQPSIQTAFNYLINTYP